MGLREVLGPRLLGDLPQEAQLLRVLPAEVEDAREDADDLPLRVPEGPPESLPVELEGVRPEGRERVRLSDPEGTVLERLADEDGNRDAILHEDEVPLLEHLEHEVEPVRPALEMEDRDPVEASLLHADDPGVVERPSKSLGERRQGLRPVLDLVEAQPPAGPRVELRLAAPGDVEAEEDLVVLLVHLVDVSPDEALPLRDEGPEVKRGEGRLHGRSREGPGFT